MTTKLTPKQRAFAENKAAGMTNRDAAVAAGYAVAAAGPTAYKLLQLPNVRAAIKAATKGDHESEKAPTNVLRMPREHYKDSKSFLLDVMNLGTIPIAMRADAAKALLPYMHPRMGETGKKETAKENARKIARGRRGKFATRQAPPKLTVVRND